MTTEEQRQTEGGSIRFGFSTVTMYDITTVLAACCIEVELGWQPASIFAGLGPADPLVTGILKLLITVNIVVSSYKLGLLTDMV